MADKDPLANFDDKKLRLMIDEIKRGREETSLWNDMFDGLSSTLFGISGSAFFKQVPKSMQEITSAIDMSNSALMKLRSDALNLEQAFRFKGITDSAGNFTSTIDVLRGSVKKTLSDYAASAKDIDDILKKISSTSGKNKNAFEALSLDEQVILMKAMNSEGMEFLDSITDVNEKVKVISELMEDNDELFIKSNRHLLKQLATHESIKDILKEETKEYEASRVKYEQLLAMSQDKMRKPSLVEALKNGIEEWTRNFGKGIVTNLFEVDTALHEIQRNTGVMMGEGVKGLSQWTMHLAEFGMSVKDAGQLIEGLGNQLGTTDQTMLMGAVDSFKSLSKALGISSDEITTIGSEMMRMGHSAEEVKDQFAFANKSAKLLGINSKNLVKQISKNIEKMRQFGFEGGIKSLTLMAAKAEKLRIQVDEIFDVAKRARTIEGAMDMAAQLQLAGGSFSNINPMELLSAARKGPEELGKILTSMGNDIGHWSEDMKTYEFNPVDVDRLNIVAEATGMSLDSIQKIIQKNAETNKKTQMLPDSMFESAVAGMDDMDAALAKSTLGDYLQMSKDGKSIELTTDANKIDLLSKAGIKDYSDINDETLHNLFDLKKQEALRLEEQAKQNMSLKESFDAFVASLTNVFTAVQPIMNAVTDALNWVSDKFGDVGKQVLAGLIIGIPLLKGILGKAFSAVFSSLGMQMGFGKKAGAETRGLAGLAGSMRKASDEAAGIKMGNVLKFSAALGIIGLSVVGFMAGLNAIGGTPSLAQLGTATASLAIMAGGLLGVSMIAKAYNTADILKFSLALAIIGAAMIPFAFSMNMMKDVGWEAVLASIVMMGLGIVALMAIGAMLTGPQALFLVVGAAALALVGLSMMAAASALNIAGDAIGKLAKIDWSSIAMMGGVLAMVAPSMLAFGLASMAFANPIALLGMGLMTLQLLGLSLVMVPLSKAMDTSAVSMGKFVVAMQMLKDAVKGMDIGDVFSSISDAVADMSDVLSDSNIDVVSKALSSIRVNIDTSSVDGLRSAITSIPAIAVHVDKTELDRIGASLSSIRLVVDKEKLASDVSSLPAISVKLDASGLIEEINTLPVVSVKLDQKGLMDSVAKLPALSLDVDEKRLVDIMSSIPVLKVKVDVQELNALALEEKTIRIEVDKASFADAVAQLSDVSMGVNTDRVKSDIASLSPLSVSLDTTMLMRQLMELPTAKVKLDASELSAFMAFMPKVKVFIDPSEVDKTMALLRSVTIALDMEELISSLKGLPSIKLDIDKDSLTQALSSIPVLSVSIDKQGLMEAFASMPAMSIRIDTREFDAQISDMPVIVLGMELGGVERLQDVLKETTPIEITVELSQLKQAMEMLENKDISIDASNVYESVMSMPSLKLTIDTTSLADQLKVLPPLEIHVESSEMEKMVALLSSIKVSLDVSDVQSVLAGFKIGVDTSQLESSLSELQSLDTQRISAALSSIEATVSRVGEERSMMVKSATDDLSASNNKLQAEVMMKLVEAIDKLGAMSQTKEQGDRRIVVELEMDGRQLKTKILKDTSLQA